MNPADLIRPYLAEADRRKPHLRVENRISSCFTLLELALALAGTDWRFIGKSTRRGESGFRPDWFTPISVSCQRPDGQREDVLIDALSMDAAWYLPAVRQVKVIVNSTANELPNGDARRGPAGLGSYDITPTDEHGQPQYRWFNPPMPQRAGVGTQPATPPPPTPGVPARLPDRDEMHATGIWLDTYYASREGLQRPQGLAIGGRPDWEGVGAWLFDVYLKARLAGLTPEQARKRTETEIRRAGGPTGEWQIKHPGETP